MGEGGEGRGKEKGKGREGKGKGREGKAFPLLICRVCQLFMQWSNCKIRAKGTLSLPFALILQFDHCITTLNNWHTLRV